MGSLLRVATVYGTRPEAIKMAPVIAGLRASDALEPVVVVTGQHRQILDQVNTWFGISPDRDLDLMVHGATLGEFTSRAVAAVSETMTELKPDAVVVQGDTTSAFASGLAAFYQDIPVVHLEAGLRTGDVRSPFPEEANRRLLASITDLHLAPTATSRANLLREGIRKENIVVTGNTVIDALHWTTKREVAFGDAAVSCLIETCQSAQTPLLLVTAHRRESWGSPMRTAMRGVRRIIETHPTLRVLFPIHPNPTVRSVVEDELGRLDRVLLTEPLTYPEFAHVMAACTLVLTDSGGVQEEAPSLGKPVLVMRETTERPEAVDAGTVRLVGTQEDDVYRATDALLSGPSDYALMARAVNPYGDGWATPRVVAAVEHLLDVGQRLPDFGSQVTAQPGAATAE